MIGTEQSPMVRMLERLVDELGPNAARAALAKSHESLSNLELAGLAYQWEGVWARPNQVEPVGEWLVWLILTARGWGKTTALLSCIVRMVQRGEVRCIGMAAQNEVKTYDVNVLGLIDASPPGFVPEWIDGEMKLVWPNGAVAYAYTPEQPANIRSKNLDLAWMSELQSWPAKTREEAYLNFSFATRKGKARMVIDATPKRGHPILLRLLKAAEQDPATYRTVTGSMRENYAHLAPAAVRKLIAEYAGTTAGDEELEGKMSRETAEGVTVEPHIIEGVRRPMPPAFRRRIVSIDPSESADGDAVGLLRMGLALDDRAYVVANHSAKMGAVTWGTLAVDFYMSDRCDCLVLERNAGGDMTIETIRAQIGKRDISVVVLAKDERPPPHNPGIIYVRSVLAARSKSVRATAATTAYEKGNVLHVAGGAGMGELESTLTTWVAGTTSRSPGDLDALVHGLVDLLNLATERVDHSKGVAGIMTAQRELMKPSRGAALTSMLVGPRGRGRTI